MQEHNRWGVFEGDVEMFFLDTVNRGLVEIGLTFPDWMLLMIFLCSMIIFALDLRIGLMFLNVSLAFGLIFASLVGIETGNFLIAFFISIVLIILSLYFVNRKGVA